MRGIISRLRAGRICWDLHTLVVCRRWMVIRWGRCVLHNEIDYGRGRRIHTVTTYSWGVPYLGKGGLLNLRRRGGDGSGR